MRSRPRSAPPRCCRSPSLLRYYFWWRRREACCRRGGATRMVTLVRRSWGRSCSPRLCLCLVRLSPARPPLAACCRPTPREKGETFTPGRNVKMNKENNSMHITISLI